MTKTSLTIMAMLMAASIACAAEFHVAVRGDDANPGSKQAPFRTLQHAADLAQPGDVITVHEGVYRERVNPPRGGTSDKQRITYQAAPGEKVVLTGSEIVQHWERVTNDTWSVTLPDSFFGQFNPYADLIHGDWFGPQGRQHHTGAVYLRGDWLMEAAKYGEVLPPAGVTPLWFGVVTNGMTTLWAQFPGVNPNEQRVEINVRQTVFTPEKTGINYLAVRGFDLRNAATPWAPPTARQIGVVSAYWCKGWIIENNEISYSTCCGVALGKYGDEWDNRAESAEGYVGTLTRALTNGWNQATVGSHAVRNNHIHHCEQTGVVGSLGCAFSSVTDNDIHDIHVRQLFGGAEMAGIKFHGAIDVVIRHNHIHRCGNVSGIWLDWMAQGAQVTGNLLHDNCGDHGDIFCEMQHGPMLVANNILLSERRSFALDSQGIAVAHNLITGPIFNRRTDDRVTPFQQPHATALAGMHANSSQNDSGDHRFYNNLFVSPCDLHALDNSALPCLAAGNVFTKGSQPSKFDTNALLRPDFNPGVTLTEKPDGWYLTLAEDPAWRTAEARQSVTTKLLGQAQVSGCAYEKPDGSPLRVNTDYFGQKRSAKHPFPGPFEQIPAGRQQIKVWPAISPANCPFPPSPSLTGIEFTGRHAEYVNADTWYPSWASDDNLYSPWTDGIVNGLGSDSAGKNAATGYATILGRDPLQLQIVNQGVYQSDPSPYAGRYPCGSLVFNGVWYYGTYCLHPSGRVEHEGTRYNWPWLGPFVGFRYSTNFGKTWTQTPCTPEQPLFGEQALHGEPVKIGSPHFVDFGKNLEHSPDGKAYLVAHGTSDGTNRRFGYNSWITGDELYLLRVTPGITNLNDASKYEFFAGRGFLGQPHWSRKLSAAEPIAAWRDHMGCVTMTYDAPLRKYLMCVTDGGNTCDRFNSYLLESSRITGPFKLVQYLPHFGEQGYFLNLPSKFISPDGRTLWLCYAANFAQGWNGLKITSQPPGSRYGMCLQEIKLDEK